MILATKQGQNGLVQPKPKPYTNPTPTLHCGRRVYRAMWQGGRAC